MDLILLGTGAAEGVPSMYSRSAYEQRVRQQGGKDVRTRSAARLGETVQLDVGPDANWQMHRNGVDMYAVEHVLVTHTHNDHFQFEEVAAKSMAVAGNGKPLHLWLSAPAARWLERAVEALWGYELANPARRSYWTEHYPAHALDYFSRYQVADLVVETVAGNHVANSADERAINYLIEVPGGRRLLYALDTGYYTDDTWEYLTERHADVVVMDCTFGGRSDREEYPGSHLDVHSFLRQLTRMAEIGFIDARTDVYASHINPAQGLDHAGLQAAFDASDYRVTVGWDGLRITV